VHVQTFSHGNTSSFHHDLVLISIFIHLLLVFCRKRACVQVQTFVGAESVPAGPVVDGVQEWNIPAVSQVASTIAVGRQGCVSATHSCPVSQTRARARSAVGAGENPSVLKSLSSPSKGLLTCTVHHYLPNVPIARRARLAIGVFMGLDH
jgi:hypothetical protein